MKKLVLAAIAVCAVCLTSCTSTMPITATSNPVGNKCGEARSVRVLGMGGSSNNGINKAVKDGGITKISHVDYVKYNFLWLYSSFTTKVYGE